MSARPEMDANKPDLCFLLISTWRSLLLAIQRSTFKLLNLTEGGVFTPHIASNFIFSLNLVFFFCLCGFVPAAKLNSSFRRSSEHLRIYCRVCLISFQNRPCSILNLFISVCKVFISPCKVSADFYLYLDSEQLLSFLYHLLQEATRISSHILFFM